ncbi:MAG: DnaJ domain-containing protein [Zoogloeaceae bacterium]|nr:DnaJ domain-containing protein [Zoogloeaceae bacterium]
MPFRSLYEILGVAQGATSEEIRNAYRRQAMKWHPDRNPSNRGEAETRFKEIAYAYKVLSDPAQRAEYDDWLAAQRTANAQQRHEQEQTFDAGTTESNANKLFFEQMLDLAFELAKRGFDAEKICKTLLALDCPVGIAKAVAKIVAASYGGQQTGAKSTGMSTNNKSTAAQTRTPSAQPSAIENMSWEEAKDYYAAIIGGIHADEKINDATYNKYIKRDNSGMIGYVISFIMLFIGIFAIPSFGAYAFIPGIILLLLTIILRLTVSNSKFTSAKKMHYYITAFKSYHQRSKSLKFNICVFLFSWIWFVHRRMPFHAIAILVLYIITEIIGETFIPGKMPAGFYCAINAVLAICANHIYFLSARWKINRLIELPKQDALLRLKESGGTYSLSAFTFIIITIVLAVLGAWYVQSGQQQQQFDIGLKYHYGDGVAQDYSEATKWYRKAAAQGHAMPQNNLGVTSRNGEGVRQCDVEAVKWCRLVAEQGDAEAQYKIF